MKQRYLEAGRIINTHGVRGEVKIESWCDTPQFLMGFPTLYFSPEEPIKVTESRVHKNFLIAKLEGIDDVNAAMRLKNRILYLDREDAALPEGTHFLADLIGLEVRSADDGSVLGRLDEVITSTPQTIYVIRGGDREIMLPAVDEFIRESNPDEGFMLVHLIEGM